MRTLGLALGLLASSASGCLLIPLIDSMVPLGTTDSRVYRKITREELWDIVKDSVARDFRPKEFDERNLSLSTEWDEHLGPMYKSGRRRRAHVWVYEGDGGPYLSVQVEREVNANIKHTLDPFAAEWEAEGRDELSERRIIYLVEAKLGLQRESGTVKSPRKSPYRAAEEESDADRDKRLWGDLAK